MTAHTCTTFNPSCYRCDLGRDEEIAALAEEYHEVVIEPQMRAVGTPQSALDSMRPRYINDVRKSPGAITELYEWAAAREDES